MLSTFSWKDICKKDDLIQLKITETKFYNNFITNFSLCIFTCITHESISCLQYLLSHVYMNTILLNRSRLLNDLSIAIRSIHDPKYENIKQIITLFININPNDSNHNNDILRYVCLGIIDLGNVELLEHFIHDFNFTPNQLSAPIRYIYHVEMYLYLLYNYPEIVSCSLEVSSYFGCVNVVKKCIEKGANDYTEGYNSSYQFNCSRLMCYYLENYNDKIVSDNKYTEALEVALLTQDTILLKFLIEKGIDISNHITYLDDSYVEYMVKKNMNLGRYELDSIYIKEKWDHIKLRLITPLCKDLVNIVMKY